MTSSAGDAIDFGEKSSAAFSRISDAPKKQENNNYFFPSENFRLWSVSKREISFVCLFHT
jgi:hypothetical protein